MTNPLDIRTWAGLLLALASTAAAAQWYDQNGKPIADTPSRASENGFSASISIATAAESKRFHEEWYSTATAHTPVLDNIDNGHRGDRISILVFYAGCAVDDRREGHTGAGKPECPALMDLRILKPDGTVYEDPEEMSLAQGQPAAPPSIVQLSPVELLIRFEPEDPLGAYRIEAVIDHPERDAVLALSTMFELKPDGSAE